MPSLKQALANATSSRVYERRKLLNVVSLMTESTDPMMLESLSFSSRAAASVV